MSMSRENHRHTPGRARRAIALGILALACTACPTVRKKIPLTPERTVGPTGPRASLDVTRRLAAAERALRSGDSSRALEIYDALLQEHPRHPEATARRGVVRALRGERRGARADIQSALASRARTLDAAVAAAPDDAEILLQRAHVRSDLRQHAPAVSDAERATQLDPRSVRAFFVLGNMRVRAGDLTGGLASYDRALALDSTRPEVFVARAAARLANRDRAGAARDFARAERLAGQDTVSNRSRREREP